MTAPSVDAAFSRPRRVPCSSIANTADRSSPKHLVCQRLKVRQKQVPVSVMLKFHPGLEETGNVTEMQRPGVTVPAERKLSPDRHGCHRWRGQFGDFGGCVSSPP